MEHQGGLWLSSHGPLKQTISIMPRLLSFSAYCSTDTEIPVAFTGVCCVMGVEFFLLLFKGMTTFLLMWRIHPPCGEKAPRPLQQLGRIGWLPLPSKKFKEDSVTLPSHIILLPASSDGKSTSNICLVKQPLNYLSTDYLMSYCNFLTFFFCINKDPLVKGFS